MGKIALHWTVLTAFVGLAFLVSEGCTSDSPPAPTVTQDRSVDEDPTTSDEVQRQLDALPTEVPSGTDRMVWGSTPRVEYTSGQTARNTGNPNHFSVGTRIVYGETPPNAGAHWGVWAQCGSYEVEINDEYVVHNMEHGHVIVSYNLPNPVEQHGILELAANLPDLNQWGVIRPYSSIDEGTVVLTAWGVSSGAIQGVGEAAIREFYQANFKNRYSAETAQFGPIPCQ